MEPATANDSSIPLATLLAWFKARGFPLGSALSAYIVDAIARESLARNVGVSLDAVTISSGVPAIAGAGFPDPAHDVHALGSIYYLLLTGSTCEAGADLEKTLPDPRPELVALLRGAMGGTFASMLAFHEAIRADASALLADNQAPVLQRFVAELSGSEQPQVKVITVPPPSRDDAWNEVLGEKVESAPPAPRSSVPPPASSAAPTSGKIDPFANLSARVPTTPPPTEIKPWDRSLVILAVGSVVVAGIALTSLRAEKEPEEASVIEVEEEAPTEAATPGIVQFKREEDEEEEGEADARMGMISIMSQPLGAGVEIDGIFVGKTPLVLRHRFDKASYQVDLTLKGHERWTKIVEVNKSARTLSETVTLLPLGAR